MAAASTSSYFKPNKEIPWQASGGTHQALYLAAADVLEKGHAERLDQWHQDSSRAAIGQDTKDMYVRAIESGQTDVALFREGVRIVSNSLLTSDQMDSAVFRQISQKMSTIINRGCERALNAFTEMTCDALDGKDTAESFNALAQELYGMGWTGDTSGLATNLAALTVD